MANGELLTGGSNTDRRLLQSLSRTRCGTHFRVVSRRSKLIGMLTVTSAFAIQFFISREATKIKGAKDFLCSPAPLGNIQ